MLCLVLKYHENVIIELPDHSTMTVHVIEIERNKVRLGFTAADNVRMFREAICPTDVLSTAELAGQLR